MLNLASSAPTPTPTPATAPPPCARKVRVGDVELNVEVQGSGPSVLLIHGFPDSLSQWRDVAPPLQAAGYRTIALDVRGFGHSDAPRGKYQYKIAQLVADLAGLLDALGVDEPVHVMGHDWGAVLAWCFVLAHPERARSLVAVSVGHPQAYARAGLMQKLKGWYTLVFQLPRVPEALMLAASGRGLRAWAPEHPAMEEVLADMARPGRLTAGINLYRANLLKVLFGRWPRCTVPTLGVWSNQDRFLTEGQMTSTARLMDAPWEYRRLDGCAHWMPLEQPQWLAQQALRWFAQY